MEEWIDIYDRNREKTGETRPRKSAHLAPGEFMVYALALIEDGTGRFLVTRRKADKSWGALMWEIPGGGCRAGETSREACDREVLEETGLDLTGKKPVSVYCYVNEDAESHDNYFCDIYHFRMNVTMEDVHLQREETEDGKLASLPEIDAEGAKDNFLHYGRIKQALAAEQVMNQNRRK